MWYGLLLLHNILKIPFPANHSRSENIDIADVDKSLRIMEVGYRWRYSSNKRFTPKQEGKAKGEGGNTVEPKKVT